jgi:hypothetical protein
VGFVLGNFDGIGSWRTEEELGFPLDTSGELNGVPVSSLEELALELAASEQVPRCVVEQTLTYALGRRLRPEDERVVDEVTAAFLVGGLRFDALAAAVVESDAFQWRGERQEVE